MPAAAEVGKGRFGRAFLEAIDWALQMDPAQRPQSVDAWRQRLLADHVASLGAHETQRRDDQQALDDAHQPGRAAWRTRLRAWGRRWRDATVPLQARVLALVLGATLVPLSLAALLALGSARGMLHDALLRKAEGAAVGTAARMAQLVASGTRLARGLAADPGLARALATPDDAAIADLQARLQALARHNPDIDGLWVTDTTGAVRGLPAAPVPRPPGAASPVTPAATTGPPAAPVTFVAQPGGAGLLLAEPVRNAAGTLLGHVQLQLKPAALAAVLASADDGGAPLLVDDDGVVVQHLRPEWLYRPLQALAASSPAGQRSVQRYGRGALQPLGEPPLAAALQGPRAPGRISDRWAADGAPLLAGHAPVPGQRWTVLVLQPPAALQAPLSRLRTYLLAGLLLTAGVVAVLARRFARRLVQPLQALTTGTEALKAGHPEQAYVNVPRRDEIGQLARSFNGTVDVLRQRDRERATRRR
jgi:C4-dicarboxylate-specific signal transduction histidine kinase